MRKKKPFCFIDVFAGCGGLSLGLVNAGWRGIFAIEKSPLAFSTLEHNLVSNKKSHFDWPRWLPKQSMTIEELLANYAEQVHRLRGSVDLIVGGPPCQGFSFAGKRDPKDPRNRLTEQYLALVGLVKPRFLVIENVSGFNTSFSEAKKKKKPKEESYAEYVAQRIEQLGYRVSKGLVNCATFGVPQNRIRFLMICELEEFSELSPRRVELIESLKSYSEKFLKIKQLPTDRFVGTSEAISDLLVEGRELVPHTDSSGPGFFEATYHPPINPSKYQVLMRKGMGSTAPNSRRLPNHKPETIEAFQLFQRTCRPGKKVTDEERQILGMSKHSRTMLHPLLPAPTVTTLPDDILHYVEPRILTVRESARLQSFPDWFEFKGKYTTGGNRRKLETPRYSQVGNAVPPLIAEALGRVLKKRKIFLERRSKRLRSRRLIRRKLSAAMCGV
ncbi:DNA methyltransferase [Burkholderia pyrrocinia]|nr:DNA methyltransferase [Burkholderia pyrrocinia]